MQTSRKKLGIIIIVIGFIILLLVIYFGFIKKSPVATVPTENELATTTTQLEPVSTVPTSTPGDRVGHQTYNISQEAPHQPNVNDLTKIAMAFSERFGSFSSQSDYSNFTDLKLLMTDSLKDWVDSYVKKIKSEKTSGAYYGITTKALTTQVKSFDDKKGTADIIITTKRSESTQEINGGTPYNQDLELKFKKVGGDWLADEAYWLK